MNFPCPNCSGLTCDYCSHLGFVDFNLIEDEASQLDITTFILDDRNYKNKIIKN